MEIIKMLSAAARHGQTGSSPAGNMEYNSSIKRSSTPHQNFKLVKKTKTILPTQSSEKPMCSEMLRAKRCVSIPYGDAPCDQRRRENDVYLVQQKTSGNCGKTSLIVKEARDDELVRFMSNVPGYLQQVDNKEDVQGKALNVGVLDWGRLESYKCNQKGTPGSINSTLPCSNLSTKITTRSSVLRSPIGIETPYGNKLHLSRSPRNDFCGNGDIFRKAKLDHKIISKVEHQPSKTKSKLLTRRPKESVSSSDREAKQTAADELRPMDIKREPPKQIVSPNMDTLKSEPNNSSSGSIEEKQNICTSRTKNRTKSRETAVYPPPQYHADKNRNIVLLLPGSHNSFPKQPRTLLDKNVTGAKQNFLSDALSDKEAFSSELHDEILQSCPLPSKAETGTQKRTPIAINTMDDQTSSYDINNSRSRNLDATLNTLNHEVAESATRKGRNPSPNHRFSFSSLSRMTKSFSLKEFSAISQSSSTFVSVKSGPATSTSAGMNNSKGEKESSHIKARSSPLRRILDPLLPKFKGKTSSFQDEIDQQARGIHNSSLKPTEVSESPEHEKPEASSIHAQLVLTTSNGLPMFRFVTNSSIIIAAPMQNVLASWKNDPQCNFVLYAIDEIKKKCGSWINQASKEKRCFTYNVVGEMKLNSSSSLDLPGKNSNIQDIVKESVLFGVEPRQTGQALPKGMPKTELAAVIMKNPSGISGFDTQDSGKGENVKDNGLSWCLPGDVQNNSFTVILPAGIHSLPKTGGAPSSLIHRYKAGGSCDCGGWDMGCQLRVLANQKNQQPKHFRTFSSFLKSDCLQLFDQGVTQQKPVFTMAPCEKGNYAVEFSSPISLLQAFFVGVTVITSQRSSSGLNEDSIVSEEKTSWDFSGLKTFHKEEAPMKYTPTPPVSPVGRV